MSEDFLINILQNKIFHNRETKAIQRNKIEEYTRKNHSYDNNDEKFREKLNIIDNELPLSKSYSIILYPKKDLKKKEIKNQINNISVNLIKNSYNNESTFGEDYPDVKKICSSNVVNSQKKLENFRKQFLEEKKDNEIKNKNDEAKIKRPNYLIKSCFYNNNDINNTKFMRSYSKKECSPVLNFFGYKENDNGVMLKKYYKQSTFGKVNNYNETIQKKMLWKII